MEHRMSADTAPDYTEFDDGPQGDDSARHEWLNQLSKAALELPKREGDVARAEAELKRAQEALADIAERRIPELMDNLDLTVYPLRDGGQIKIKEAIRASIPKPVEPRTFAWMRANGQAALIKRAVTLTFGMGEDEKAAETLVELRGKGLQPEDKTTVHNATLVSFVKGMLEDGKELPEDLFSIMRVRTAKVST